MRLRSGGFAKLELASNSWPRPGLPLSHGLVSFMTVLLTAEAALANLAAGITGA
ncbi:MAG: hypothetical protein JWP15_2505 [Alphaproteobacteria bacterium]|nr:hypothetical protein [Alphaproteobacteria bacterium]